MKGPSGDFNVNQNLMKKMIMLKFSFLEFKGKYFGNFM